MTENSYNFRHMRYLKGLIGANVILLAVLIFLVSYNTIIRSIVPCDPNLVQELDREKEHKASNEEEGYICRKWEGSIYQRMGFVIVSLTILTFIAIQITFDLQVMWSEVVPTMDGDIYIRLLKRWIMLSLNFLLVFTLAFSSTLFLPSVKERDPAATKTISIIIMLLSLALIILRFMLLSTGHQYYQHVKEQHSTISMMA